MCLAKKKLFLSHLIKKAGKMTCFVAFDVLAGTTSFVTFEMVCRKYN